MKALCHAFMEDYSKPHKKSWREDARRFEKYVLPALGRRKAQAVTQADVVKLHNRIGRDLGHPREANNVRNLLQTMFRFASENGFVPRDHPNPAQGVDKFPERSRERWVRPSELPRLAEAIEEEPNLYVRAAFWLLLLTGLRKSELLTAEWEQVDFERGELRLDETKSGRRHYVPLCEPAMEILKNLPREKDNEHILPGKIPGQHLVNISKPWGRIRRKANLTDVRIHDLRRTVGSWLVASGHSLQIVGKLLNHSNPSTTQIYAHLAQDPVREAMEQHGSKIVEIYKLRRKRESA